jgi:CSLREA domain-containing protein
MSHIKLFSRVLVGAAFCALAVDIALHSTPSAASAPAALNADITVTSLGDAIASDGVCTLREAITAANTNATVNECVHAGSAGMDSIQFSVSGTITLTSALPDISGDLALAGPGASNLTISGANLYRVFYVNSNVTLDLQNLTIANGYVADNSGGGVLCLPNSTLTVTNSVFTGNSALSGGAIYGCFQTITNSAFIGNSATGDYSSGAGTGGAISCVSLTATNSAFTGNSAQRGGAIKCDGALAVTNSTFTNNSVNGIWYPVGGAMLIYGPSAIMNSTFSGNSASGSSVKSGGAINMPSTYGLTIANSTFFSNTVSGAGSNWGGAIYKYSSVPSTLTVTNSTFSGNSASGGASNLAGGIYNDGVTTVTLRNTIMANSSCSGTITDGGNNLQFPGDTCGVSIPTADPLLGALADNGGSTQTMALGIGSPAVDAGNDAVCAASPVNNRDQRGYVRPADGDNDSSAICDIGAYEYNAVPPPTPPEFKTYLPLVRR